MNLYVTHENFARAVNPYTWYSKAFQAFYVGSIADNLLP